MHQFTTRLRADHENPLAIFADQRKFEVQRAVGQLHGLGSSTQPRGILRQRPHTVPAFPKALEHEVPTVGSPLPAAFMGNTVPTGKQGAQTASVAGHLPDRTGTIAKIGQVKTKPAAVGRKVKPGNQTSRSY